MLCSRDGIFSGSRDLIRRRFSGRAFDAGVTFLRLKGLAFYRDCPRTTRYSSVLKSVCNNAETTLMELRFAVFSVDILRILSTNVDPRSPRPLQLDARCEFKMKWPSELAPGPHGSNWRGGASRANNRQYIAKPRWTILKGPLRDAILYKGWS